MGNVLNKVASTNPPTFLTEMSEAGPVSVALPGTHSHPDSKPYHKNRHIATNISSFTIEKKWFHHD